MPWEACTAAGRPSQQASRTGAAARQLGMLQLILSLSFWHGKRAQGNTRAVSDWKKNGVVLHHDG